MDIEVERLVFQKEFANGDIVARWLTFSDGTYKVIPEHQSIHSQKLCDHLNRLFKVWVAAKGHAAGRRELMVHIKKRPLAREEFGVYWGPTFHKRLAAFHTRAECHAWATNNGYEVAE